MDTNKLVKLKKVNYSFKPVCFLCNYGLFYNSDWGTCQLHTYDHIKHGNKRQMSIHKCGGCEDFNKCIKERVDIFEKHLAG